MHRCSCCDTPCNCGGDTGASLTDASRPGCTHCIRCCDHGVPIDLACLYCDTDSFELEEDATERAHDTEPFINSGP